jgi:hypothetical protein
VAFILVGVPAVIALAFVGMSWAEAFNNVGQAKAKAVIARAQADLTLGKRGES